MGRGRGRADDEGFDVVGEFEGTTAKNERENRDKVSRDDEIVGGESESGESA